VGPLRKKRKENSSLSEGPGAAHQKKKPLSRRRKKKEMGKQNRLSPRGGDLGPKGRDCEPLPEEKENLSRGGRVLAQDRRVRLHWVTPRRGGGKERVTRDAKPSRNIYR